MITPRADFRKNPVLSKGWQDFMDSRQFTTACQTALAEMDLQNYNVAGDLGSAAALCYRKQGAIQFLKILTGLMESDVQQKRPTGATLDYNK